MTRFPRRTPWLVLLTVGALVLGTALFLWPSVPTAPLSPPVHQATPPVPGAGSGAALPDVRPSTPHRTAPAGSGGPAVSFTASGDFGAGPDARAVFAQISSLDPDLHLALGDFSYGQTDTDQDWCELVTSHTGPDLPFQLLAGNHESYGRDGHIDEFAQCLPNRLPGLVGSYGRQWYVDVPAADPLVRIVMISPGMNFGAGRYSYDSGTAEHRWTADAIDGARQESVPWVVVGMHSPCLSVGEYGCRSGTDVHDLLLAEEVDLVLHGHEHLYQRTHQLTTTPGCRSVTPGAYDPRCVADTDDELRQGAGTVFATVGTGGAALRDVHPEDPEARYFAAVSGANADPSHGSLHVRITAETLHASFAPTGSGRFKDAFTITAGE